MHKLSALALTLSILVSVVLAANPGSAVPLAKLQFFGNSGEVLARGRLYSYVAGTSVPLPTYSDSALSKPNANPAILDQFGRASLYIGSQTYKFVLKNDVGNTIWTQDNVGDLAQMLATKLGTAAGASMVVYRLPTPQAVEMTVSQKLAQTVNLQEFGAKCDGETNDAVAIANAIAYCSSLGGATITLPPTGSLCMTSLSIDLVAGCSFQGTGINSSGFGALSGERFSTFESTYNSHQYSYLTSLGPASGDQKVCVNVPNGNVAYSQFRNVQLNGHGFVGITALNFCGQENSGYSDDLITGGTYAELAIQGSGAQNSHYEYLDIGVPPGAAFGILSNANDITIRDVTIEGAVGSTADGLLVYGSGPNIPDRIHGEELNSVVHIAPGSGPVKIAHLAAGPNIGTAAVIVDAGSNGVDIGSIDANGSTALVKDSLNLGGAIVSNYGETSYTSTRTPIGGNTVISSDPAVPWLAPAPIVSPLLASRGELDFGFHGGYQGRLSVGPAANDTFLVVPRFGLTIQNTTRQRSSSVTACTNAVPMVCTVGSIEGAVVGGTCVITDATPSTFNGNYTILSVSKLGVTLSNVEYPGMFSSAKIAFSLAGVGQAGGLHLSQSSVGDPGVACITAGTYSDGCDWSTGVTPAATAVSGIGMKNGTLIFSASAGMTPNTPNQDIGTIFTMYPLTPFSGLQIDQYLTASNGGLTFCTNCKVTSASNNACTSGGSGSPAFKSNGVWKCI